MVRQVISLPRCHPDRRPHWHRWRNPRSVHGGWFSWRLILPAVVAWFSWHGPHVDEAGEAPPNWESMSIHLGINKLQVHYLFHHSTPDNRMSSPTSLTILARYPSSYPISSRAFAGRRSTTAAEKCHLASVRGTSAEPNHPIWFKWDSNFKQPIFKSSNIYANSMNLPTTSTITGSHPLEPHKNHGTALPWPGLSSFCASRRSWLSMGRGPMSLITASNLAPAFSSCFMPLLASDSITSPHRQNRILECGQSPISNNTVISYKAISYKLCCTEVFC